MTIALIIAATLIILSLVALTYFIEETNVHERRRAAEMLQLMADRVQRPEMLPVRDTRDFEVPEQEPDEWNTVGTIQIDPKYGLSDDTDG